MTRRAWWEKEYWHWQTNNKAGLVSDYTEAGPYCFIWQIRQPLTWKGIKLHIIYIYKRREPLSCHRTTHKLRIWQSDINRLSEHKERNVYSKHTQRRTPQADEYLYTWHKSRICKIFNKKYEYALLCTQTIVYLHHQIRLIGYIKGIKIKRT